MVSAGARGNCSQVVVRATVNKVGYSDEEVVAMSRAWCEGGLYWLNVYGEVVVSGGYG